MGDLVSHDRRPRAGLEDVVVGRTAISHVDGVAGRLIYRGLDAVTLAESRSFEAVWHLLHLGSLPDPDEERGFSARIAEAGVLSRRETRLVAGVVSGSPLASVRSGVSVVAAERGFGPWLEADPAALPSDALSLAAAFPAVVATVAASLRNEPPAPPGTGSHTARCLRGITGSDPDARTERLLDRYLSLTADHGMNSSTFVARIVASTGADVGAAVVAALGALSGPLHGGAPGPVLDMLDEIERPDRARDWIAGRIRDGHRIMGFGHRVYRTDDPRALSLRRAAIEAGIGRADLAEAVESAALEVLAEMKPSRPLRTNVEYWAAVTLEACGVPRDLFTPTFAVSRAVGWTAHVLEQASDNRLIRPGVEYVGPTPRTAAAG
jgi:citrate synthase